MNYVVRCEAPKEGANPNPKPGVLRIFSNVTGDWVLRDATPEAVLKFLGEKAAEREIGARRKEIVNVQRRLADNPHRSLDSFPIRFRSKTRRTASASSSETKRGGRAAGSV